MQSFRQGQAVEFYRNGVWVQGEYVKFDPSDETYCVHEKGKGSRWVWSEEIRAITSDFVSTSKTFTFKMFPMKGLTDPEAFLNEKGAEGWRLAAIDYGCFIMEKEVQ